MVWTFLQVVVIIVQSKYGGRVFLKRFFPSSDRYNYYRNNNNNQDIEMGSLLLLEGGRECVICYSPIEFHLNKHMVIVVVVVVVIIIVIIIITILINMFLE